MNCPPSERHQLSKSTFMLGVQCPKRLWLYKKRPDLKPPIAASQQMVFDKGTNAGILAQQLFPGGKDASPIDSFHYPESVQQTYDWIIAGEQIIYEAAFQFEKVMAALDILVNRNGNWYAYEVKASTQVKEQFVTDAALQYHVMTNAGLEIEDISIVHLNKDYVRKGDLDIHQLFKIVSVKKEVLALQEMVKAKIAENKSILQLENEPAKNIGLHCNKPYACDFQGYCWNHIPEVSVFDLCRLTEEKKFELYNNGIVEFSQIPENYPLSHAQQMQVKSHLENSNIIETESIKKWLSKLRYPLFFMDFETFMPAVPLYDKSRPYQQLLFQFSVHRQDGPDTAPEHFEFLGTPETDPRPGFAEALIEATKGEGTILVYSSFEASRLRKLMEDFPEYGTGINGILQRIVDLMHPFQQNWYYTASMNGSYSIKKVMPALVPELSYDNLPIGDGGTAMAAFEGLLDIHDKYEKLKIRNALLEYCKLDTWAMYKILEKLRKI